MAETPGIRTAVLHCPFCADEDLFPFDDDSGSVTNAWECRSCLRVFSVKLHGLARTGSTPGGEDAR